MEHDAVSSWDKAEKYFDSFEPGPWRDAHEPIREMVAWIGRQGLKSDLFLRYRLSGLWISDRPHKTFGGHILHVECRGDFVSFVYERTPYATDGMSKVVEREHAVESLREFLIYKFGVYRSPDSKNA